MLRRDAVHTDGAHLYALAPVELDHLAAGVADEVTHPEAGDETGTAARERRDRRDIGMVVVIV